MLQKIYQTAFNCSKMVSHGPLNIHSSFIAVSIENLKMYEIFVGIQLLCSLEYKKRGSAYYTQGYCETGPGVSGVREESRYWWELRGSDGQHRGIDLQLIILHAYSYAHRIRVA